MSQGIEPLQNKEMTASRCQFRKCLRGRFLPRLPYKPQPEQRSMSVASSEMAEGQLSLSGEERNLLVELSPV